MRAAVVETPGGLERLRLEDVAEPAVGPGQVLIDVVRAACNWGDIQKRQGIYPDPIPYPSVLGGEVTGFVRACGRGVSALREGQAVSAITGPAMLGGFADMVVVPEKYVIPLPPGMDGRMAAAFPVVALTAYHLLYTAHRVRKGETILVHAIGGGVGLALTQLATAAGARVIGTVGSPAKTEIPLKFGAARVIARDKEDFVEVALAETGGRGVDLVIDSLGSDILRRSFDALRTYGRVINIGEAAGDPHFDIRKKLYERSTSLAGFELLHAVPGSQKWRRGLRHVIEAIEARRLTIPVAAEFPLAEIRAAQACLESRGTVGKVLIAVNP
ncbi:quinone oxidoreductase family protein [Rhodoligotrophos defluvii]|uniref:quinone oxidoreductase family protein n=1 Tax=Rhodoligotrophos defluvii TaxID=2561934 RepID=UPI001484FE36|nr:zinc-binding dehydrogenase [Rhodoligotrophos defluvii]